MEDYTAHASADGWGTPQIHQWEIRTAKYSDTGERYYAFHIKGHATQAIITKEGTVQYILADSTLVMERGDKFPFSR